MPQQLTLRITLLKPTTGVDFGLQHGQGASYETIQKQRSSGHDLAFEAVIQLKTTKDGSPDFGGPLVQGPVGERFLYIDIGSFAGQADGPARRLKIPLKTIDDHLLKEASPYGMILHTRVAGTGRDGGPSCGTVKPFEGWKTLART